MYLVTLKRNRSLLLVYEESVSSSLIGSTVVAKSRECITFFFFNCLLNVNESFVDLWVEAVNCTGLWNPPQSTALTSPTRSLHCSKLDPYFVNSNHSVAEVYGKGLSFLASPSSLTTGQSAFIKSTVELLFFKTVK